MKEVKMFILEGCPHCRKAREMMNEIFSRHPEYAKVPFAKMTIDSINSADPNAPTVKPVPYVGVQFVAIPEFQGLGTSVGEIFSAALAGQKTADEALAEAQTLVTDEMKAAGYIQ